MKFDELYLSANGYMGPRDKFSRSAIIYDEDKVCKYIKDFHKNINLSMFSIDEDYTLDEFLNFEYRYNNYGFRDDLDYSINNTENEIWCFGCSYTEGIGVPINRAWPSLIQKKTNLITRNFGIAGAGYDTILRLMDYWLTHSKYPPKYILVLGYFINRFEVYNEYKNTKEFLRINMVNDQLHNNISGTAKKYIDKKTKLFRGNLYDIIKGYRNRLEQITDGLNLIEHDVMQYNMAEQFDLGRDVTFMPKFSINKFRTFLATYLDESDLTYTTHTFGTNWRCHAGIKFQQHIASEFLKNLTI